MIRILLLILISITSLNSYSQKFKANQKVSFKIAMDDLDRSTIDYVKKNNSVDYLAVIYGDHIYPNNSRKMNKTSLRKEIERIFPDKNSTGYAMLDWEGPVYNTLVGLAKGKNGFNVNLNEFILTMKYVKQLRPNIKWGFFNIPLRRNFYKSTKEFNSYVNGLLPLIKESDVLYMAFYKNFKIQDPNIESIEKLIQLAKSYKKEAFAVVWDRYDSTDKSLRHNLLPKYEFESYLNKLINTSYNGFYLNGVIWWGRDTWFYHGTKDNLPSSRKSIGSFKTDYNNRVKNYVNDLIK